MNRSRAAWLIAIKAAISAGLLLLVFRHLGSAGIIAQLKRVDLRIAALALVPQLVAILIMATRWRVLAMGLLTFRQSVKYTFIGLFYGAVLPGGVSGDVAKGAIVAWKDRSTRTAVLPVSIVADRLIGLYVLGVLFFAACAFMSWRPPAGSALLAQLGGTGLLLSGPLVVLVPVSATDRGRQLAERLFIRRLPWAAARGFGQRMMGVVETYSNRRRVWLSALLLSGALHACNILIYVLVLHALHVHMPLHLIIVLYAVLSVLVMVPISVSGLGVREWFTLAYFPAVGAAAETGVAFSLTCLALAWLFASLGAGWQVLDLMSGRRRDAPSSV